MTYKKKLITMVSLVSVLALTYILSLLLSPEFSGTRSANHTWLDPKQSAAVSRITINSPYDSMELVRRNSQWYVSHNGKEYPAKRLRVSDFLSVFTTRSPWPVRYTNADSHQRIGVDSESASRVAIYSDNTALLDLLIGYEDTTGDVFVRRYGQNEVRSGSSLLSYYARDSVNSWHNLRLIPETEDASIDLQDVQRLSVYIEDRVPQIYARRNRSWELSGVDAQELDQNDVETYIRTVLNTEGDSFSDEVLSNDPMFAYGRLVIELGTGSVRTIRISDMITDEETQASCRYANISGSDYVYRIPSWAAGRMIR